jgi:hypothetical protein
MKCRAPSAGVRWKCKTPFSFEECGNKCAHARESELGYHSHKHEEVKEVVRAPVTVFVGSAKD